MKCKRCKKNDVTRNNALWCNACYGERDVEWGKYYSFPESKDIVYWPVPPISKGG